MKVYYTNSYREEFKGRNFSHILLEKVLKERCGVADPSVVREDGVRPVLLGTSGPFFSVSHTDNVWVCAVSERNVGIDIEKATKQVINPRALAVRFFDEYEAECVLRSETEADLARCFLYCWTRKEALLKYTGEGLKGLKNAGCTVEDTVRDARGSVYLKTLLRDDLYVSIASEGILSESEPEFICIDKTKNGRN